MSENGIISIPYTCIDILYFRCLRKSEAELKEFKFVFLPTVFHPYLTPTPKQFTLRDCEYYW